jgi:hypothetical protein
VADNFVANSGSGGSTFSADDIGAGLLLPRVKPMWGVDGSGVDTSATNPLPVQLVPTNGNGTAAPFRSLDLDETEEEVKATAGTIFGLIITNFATTTRYIKFYNADAATTVVGTTTPYMTIPVPGNASDHTTLVATYPFGLVFSTAISVAATTGLADNDTGAPSANDVAITVFKV